MAVLALVTCAVAACGEPPPPPDPRAEAADQEERDAQRRLVQLRGDGWDPNDGRVDEDEEDVVDEVLRQAADELGFDADEADYDLDLLNRMAPVICSAAIINYDQMNDAVEWFSTSEDLELDVASALALGVAYSACATDLLEVTGYVTTTTRP